MGFFLPAFQCLQLGHFCTSIQLKKTSASELGVLIPSLMTYGVALNTTFNLTDHWEQQLLPQRPTVRNKGHRYRKTPCKLQRATETLSNFNVISTFMSNGQISRASPLLEVDYLPVHPPEHHLQLQRDDQIPGFSLEKSGRVISLAGFRRCNFCFFFFLTTWQFVLPPNKYLHLTSGCFSWLCLIHNLSTS